jgi:hypothetical protein
MLNILYMIIIFPLVQFLDAAYFFADRLFHSAGLSVLGVSLAVSVCTLPLYFMAEGWQQRERDAEARLAAGVARIKAVFSGKAIQSRDSAGATILHLAAKKGDVEAIKQLLTLGADKDAKDTAGESPLDIARRWNQKEAADLLS